MRRGLHENREKGYFCGGRILYGYKIVNKQVVIDEPKADVIRFIFQQYAGGFVARDIIKDLTSRGIYKKENSPFKKNNIYEILCNERFIWIHHTSDGIYTNIYPPIISQSLFNAVKIMFTKNKQGGRSNKTIFLLKGRVRCGYCGNNVQGDSGTCRNGTINYYYKCAGRKNKHICNKSIFKKEFLESLVLDKTIEIFSNEKNLDIITNAVLEINKKRLAGKSLLSILNSDKIKVKNSIDNLLKAIETGILTSTTKDRMNEFEQRLAEIDCQILIEEEKLKNQLTKEKIEQFITESLKKYH